MAPFLQSDLKLSAGSALCETWVSFRASFLENRHALDLHRLFKGRSGFLWRTASLSHCLMAQVHGTFPLCPGELIDIWIFADLSLKDFVGKGKQEELWKKPHHF